MTDLRHLNTEDKVDALAQAILVTWDQECDKRRLDHNNFTLHDFILGEFDEFTDALYVQLGDDGYEHEDIEEIIEYPGYVYLGLGEMAYWEWLQDQNAKEDAEMTEDEADDVVDGLFSQPDWPPTPSN